MFQMYLTCTMLLVFLRALPSSLLLLSRTFTVTLPIVDMEKKEALELERLKNTLSTLPENVTEDVAMEVLRDE